jgi:hypothetical protein
VVRARRGKDQISMEGSNFRGLPFWVYVGNKEKIANVSGSCRASVVG